MPWLVPFIAIAVIPGAFASLWGPKYVSPGLAGLLMMTEIIFGSITAALFADEPFGTREIFGIILISSASLFEPVYDMIKSRNNKQKSVQKNRLYVGLNSSGLNAISAIVLIFLRAAL